MMQGVSPSGLLTRWVRCACVAVPGVVAHLEVSGGGGLCSDVTSLPLPCDNQSHLQILPLIPGGEIPSR